MSDPRQVLLTGGTGFIGRRLARCLYERGARITVVARAGSDVSALPPGTALIRADLAEDGPLPDALLRAAEAADTVIHAAACLFARRWQDYFAGNTRAAARLGAACAGQNGQPRRVLFISSLAASGPCALPPGRDEDAPPAPVSAYGWSKLLAERELAAALRAVPLTVLRPPVVYGQGDRALLPFFRAAARGLIACPGLRPASLSFIHVDDLVEAALFCLERDLDGPVHLEDGHPSSMAAFGRAIAAAAGRRARVLPVPLPLVRGAAYGAAALSRLTGHIFPLTIDKALEAAQPGWLANGARLRAMGFCARIAPEQGIPRTLRAYRDARWL